MPQEKKKVKKIQCIALVNPYKWNEPLKSFDPENMRSYTLIEKDTHETYVVDFKSDWTDYKHCLEDFDKPVPSIVRLRKRAEELHEERHAEQLDMFPESVDEEFPELAISVQNLYLHPLEYLQTYYNRAIEIDAEITALQILFVEEILNEKDGDIQAFMDYVNERCLEQYYPMKLYGNPPYTDLQVLLRDLGDCYDLFRRRNWRPEKYGTEDI